MTRTIQGALWLSDPSIQAVMDALEADGGAARFVGGCVRNALLGVGVSDIDIATPLPPDAVTQRLKARGLSVVPTGVEHGTVTALTASGPLEITTLRRDVETDGRRAVVAFTDRWEEDAGRRDFTINALYASRSGQVYDYFDGLADLDARLIRFVGDAGQRIQEDYLRILRFFRMHAFYGQGALDTEGLAACRLHAAGLGRLAGERIQKEMLRLLEAAAPAPVLDAMAGAGVLERLIEGPIATSRLARMCVEDSTQGTPPDALQRLAALLDGGETQGQAVAQRWRLSNDDRHRLLMALGPRGELEQPLSLQQARALIYRWSAQLFCDRVRLALANDARADRIAAFRALLSLAQAWPRPSLPVDGRDVMAAGIREGQRVGQILGAIEEIWIASDFTLERPQLLDAIAKTAQP